MLLRIRPAIPADLPAILAIYNDAVLNTTASYDETPGTLEARVAWYEEHIQQHLPILVAADNRDIVGWSAFSPFRPRVGYRYTVEHSVYVIAQRRGQGIGRALLAPLIGSARQLGMHAMIGLIDAENTASIRMHAALGFMQVAHFKEVGYKFGRWLDLICMELVLSMRQ
jgi:L-amino acid N-acyltransferase